MLVNFLCLLVLMFNNFQNSIIVDNSICEPLLVYVIKLCFDLFLLETIHLALNSLCLLLITFVTNELCLVWLELAIDSFLLWFVLDLSFNNFPFFVSSYRVQWSMAKPKMVHDEPFVFLNGWNDVITMKVKRSTNIKYSMYAYGTIIGNLGNVVP